MDWDRDLSTWPHANWSRQVRSRPHLWHVQEVGPDDPGAPLVLFLHGAGASTHSWRAVLPLLQDRFRLVAIDLPGQGFTRLGSRQRCSLDAMTADIATLCGAEGWQPAGLVGHSAGAAIALQLSGVLRAGGGACPRVVGINPALAQFDGIAGWLFPVLAKLLALNPLTARAFTLGGGRISQARKLIESTGSRLDDEGLALYARLIGDRAHVDGTLRMMAQWSHQGLLANLPRIDARCVFITGAHDQAVPPETAQSAAGRMPDASVIALPDLGHLAHEEDPARLAALIAKALS